MINTKLHNKALKKWEPSDSAARAQTAMGCHGVLHIWDDLGTDASSEEALGIVGFKMMAQKFVNWLLIYQQFTVHWNWPYDMDWETAECL